MTMVYQSIRSVVVLSFEKEVLQMIDVSFEFGSLPKKNKSEVFSMIVHPDTKSTILTKITGKHSPSPHFSANYRSPVIVL